MTLPSIELWFQGYLVFDLILLTDTSGWHLFTRYSPMRQGIYLQTAQVPFYMKRYFWLSTNIHRVM
jgi:hypothetical protein